VEGGGVRVLVACEFSATVRDTFRARGHDAWSCDLLPTEGDPAWHWQEDVLSVLARERFDLMIAHPPCTYLSNMSNCRIHEPARLAKRNAALTFFIALINASIPRIAVENPRGYPERAFRKSDQIIQPWQFGHEASKATCLWLKNLPLLQPTNIVSPKRKWDGKRWRTWVDSFGKNNAKRRSVTFSNIAVAMAAQWGALPTL
jgi:site-specific DNA-cytosine methylase